VASEFSCGKAATVAARGRGVTLKALHSRYENFSKCAAGPAHAATRVVRSPVRSAIPYCGVDGARRSPPPCTTTGELDMHTQARNERGTAGYRYPATRETMAARMRQLCICLLVALPAVSSIAVAPLPAAGSTQAPAKQPNRPATIWPVTSCNDGDAGSLRDIIETPGKAQSGDSINLSGIPAICGMTSVITLLNGEIHVAQDDLELHGPDPTFGMGTVAISGGSASGIFHHTGTGTLSIHALTLQDGYAHDPTGAAGGCIRTAGNVELDQSRVIDCTAKADMGYAHGGGIFAQGHVQLVDSTISGNKVMAPAAYGLGGGIYATGDLIAKYASIDHNTVYDSNSSQGVGGGAAIGGNCGIYHSTIDHNAARTGSAIVSTKQMSISNSTISGNHGGVSAVHTLTTVGSVSLEINNSTIAFNELLNSSGSGAVVFQGQPTDSLALYSSIIAKNTAGNTPADIYLAQGLLGGADNLVIGMNFVPPPNVITITADPRLGPLQLNGGPLRTHALLPGSPAIGTGNDYVTFPQNDTNTYDERGHGYSRATGSTASVDLGAFQFDTIFFDDFD
jgi:hypothetical protein